MEELYLLLAAVALLFSGTACVCSVAFWLKGARKKPEEARRMQGLESRVRRLEQEQTRLVERIAALEAAERAEEDPLAQYFSAQVEKLLRYQPVDGRGRARGVTGLK